LREDVDVLSLAVEIAMKCINDDRYAPSDSKQLRKKLLKLAAEWQWPAIKVVREHG
jgi:hypothetical protein